MGIISKNIVKSKSVSQKTKNQYNSSINKIKKGIKWRGTTSNFLLTKSDKIIQWIEDSPLSTSSKKTYAISLYSIFKDYNNSFKRKSAKRTRLLNLYNNNMEMWRDRHNSERS